MHLPNLRQWLADSQEPQAPAWYLYTHLLVMQGSICSELLRRLAEFGPSLARAVALAAEVDCLAALALAAREGGYARPVLTSDNVLHIQQGACCFFFECFFHPEQRHTWCQTALVIAAHRGVVHVHYQQDAVRCSAAGHVPEQPLLDTLCS